MKRKLTKSVLLSMSMEDQYIEPPAVSATPPAVTLMEEPDCMPHSPGMQKVGRNKKILSTIRMETYLSTGLIN
jgi:hypothetical protein